ncbi:MAG: hypothetical protein ACE361_26275 [Aureliella sp.]
MNSFGKLALVMSTVAPVLGAFGINAFSNGATSAGWWYVGIALGMIVITALILFECHRRIETETLKIETTKSVDKESLSFLLVYLLPLLAKDVNQFTGDTWTAFYVFGVIALVVAHGNLVTFNPVFALFRLHFYEVKTVGGMTCTFVSKQIIKKQSGEYRAIEVYPFFYMEAK